MNFRTFSDYLQKLENTSKRLEITDILTDLIQELSPDEIDRALYLASGYLTAPFRNKPFNIAEKMMIKIISRAYSKSESGVVETFKKIGDLGITTQKISDNDAKRGLTVLEVHQKLEEIAYAEGTGSQERKTIKTAELLNKLDSLSAKFLVRIILGTTRLGYTELTIMDALAQFLGNKKGLKTIVEEKYNIHPDIGLVAKIIKEEGTKGLDKITIETGVPVLSQKCQRIKSMDEIFEKISTPWAEYKFDGIRVQLHLDRSKKADEKEVQSLFEKDSKKTFIKTFTRNLEETTHMFPEVIEAANRYIKADSVILDGEVVGYNKKMGEFLPFQEIMQRKRKYDVSQKAYDIPVKYLVFDILFLDGGSLIKTALAQRKKLIEKVLEDNDFIVPTAYIPAQNPAELKEYFEKAKRQHLEGLVVKNPEDFYQAGARSFSWVKFKTADEKLLEDTVDLVILGYYKGRGIRSKFGIGGFLGGIYDEKKDSFKTLTKVGTGLTDEEWEKIKKLCDKSETEKKPSNYEINKTLEPDVYTLPRIVVEIGADEISASPNHTAGYALRFPRLISFREDKKATDATTLKEVERMYRSKKRGRVVE